MLYITSDLPLTVSHILIKDIHTYALFPTLLAPDSQLYYIPNFIASAAVPALMAAVIQEVPLAQVPIRLFGKMVLQPRLTAWVGDPNAAYTYSGVRNEPQAWTPALNSIRHRLAALLGQPFNAVLLNLYRNGADSMGYHADDEPELGSQPVIASISMGAERRFTFRPKTRKRSQYPTTGNSIATQHIVLASGSLLVMAGAFQRDWQHALPRTARPSGPRLNLTFRNIIA